MKANGRVGESLVRTFLPTPTKSRARAADLTRDGAEDAFREDERTPGTMMMAHSASWSSRQRVPERQEALARWRSRHGLLPKDDSLETAHIENERGNASKSPGTSPAAAVHVGALQVAGASLAERLDFSFGSENEQAHTWRSMPADEDDSSTEEARPERLSTMPSFSPDVSQIPISSPSQLTDQGASLASWRKRIERRSRVTRTPDPARTILNPKPSDTRSLTSPTPRLSLGQLQARSRLRSPEKKGAKEGKSLQHLQASARRRATQFARMEALATTRQLAHEHWFSSDEENGLGYDADQCLKAQDGRKASRTASLSTCRDSLILRPSCFSGSSRNSDLPELLDSVNAHPGVCSHSLHGAKLFGEAMSTSLSSSSSSLDSWRVTEKREDSADQGKLETITGNRPCMIFQNGIPDSRLPAGFSDSAGGNPIVLMRGAMHPFRNDKPVSRHLFIDKDRSESAEEAYSDQTFLSADVVVETSSENKVSETEGIHIEVEDNGKRKDLKTHVLDLNQGLDAKSKSVKASSKRMHEVIARGGVDVEVNEWNGQAEDLRCQEVEARTEYMLSRRALLQDWRRRHQHVNRENRQLGNRTEADMQQQVPSHTEHSMSFSLSSTKDKLYGFRTGEVSIHEFQQQTREVGAERSLQRRKGATTESKDESSHIHSDILDTPRMIQALTNALIGMPISADDCNETFLVGEPKKEAVNVLSSEDPRHIGSSDGEENNRCEDTDTISLWQSNRLSFGAAERTGSNYPAEQDGGLNVSVPGAEYIVSDSVRCLQPVLEEMRDHDHRTDRNKAELGHTIVEVQRSVSDAEEMKKDALALQLRHWVNNAAQIVSISRTGDISTEKMLLDVVKFAQDSAVESVDNKWEDSVDVSGSGTLRQCHQDEETPVDKKSPTTTFTRLRNHSPQTEEEWIWFGDPEGEDVAQGDDGRPNASPNLRFDNADSHLPKDHSMQLFAEEPKARRLLQRLPQQIQIQTEDQDDHKWTCPAKGNDPSTPYSSMSLGSPCFGVRTGSAPTNKMQGRGVESMSCSADACVQEKSRGDLASAERWGKLSARVRELSYNGLLVSSILLNLCLLTSIFVAAFYNGFKYWPGYQQH